MKQIRKVASKTIFRLYVFPELSLKAGDCFGARSKTPEACFRGTPGKREPPFSRCRRLLGGVSAHVPAPWHSLLKSFDVFWCQ